LHFKDEFGRWLPVSSTLVEAANGRLRNEANRYRVDFGPDLAGDFLAMTIQDVPLSWSLSGAKASKAQRERSRLVYPQAFDGVDLQYDVLPDAVKETLMLESAAVPTSYRFRLSTPVDGLTPQAQPDGSWLFFTPGQTEPLFALERPEAIDGRGTGSGETPNATLDVTAVGGGFDVVLGVDRAWLQDPVRAFPVALDPTILISGSTTTQDAFWNMRCGSCLGSRTDRLKIGTTDSEVFRSAVQFDIAGVPSGSAVRGAELRLRYDETCLPLLGGLSAASVGTCGTESHILRALERQTPFSSATRSSELGSGFNSTSYTLENDPLAGPRTMTWNVLSSVKAWYAGDRENFGFTLQRSNEDLNKSGPTPPSSRATLSRPELVVTYGETVIVLPSDTVRPTGAEVRWTRYRGEVPFAGYEIFRVPTAGGTKQSLGVVDDVATTVFRDDTAAPGSWRYSVAVRKTNGDSDESLPRTVTLPAANTSKAIKLTAEGGEATQITAELDADGNPVGTCLVGGSATQLTVGRTPTALSRALLRFDLSDVPADAELVSARLRLPSKTHTDGIARQLVLEPAAADWQEGTGDSAGTPACTGTGATWLDRTGGAVGWAQEGGDATGSPQSFTLTPGSTSDVDLRGLVTSWLRGGLPNHGVRVRSADEASATNLAFTSDDAVTSSFASAPRLELVYLEPQLRLQAPSVAITSPVDGAKLTGMVTLAATALDETAVDRVEFTLTDTKGTTSLGTDTGAPWQITVDSAKLPNSCAKADSLDYDDSEQSLYQSTQSDADGAELCRAAGEPPAVLKATAYDTTDPQCKAPTSCSSAQIEVRVANALTPVAQIQFPPDGAVVTGTVNVQAAINPDDEKTGLYAKVAYTELLVDGKRVAQDRAVPYELPWDTLDPAAVAYDGPHTLTLRVVDVHGQTGYHSIKVSTANTVGKRFQASYTASGLPTELTYDDDTSSPKETASVAVTVTNTSALPWLEQDQTQFHVDWIRPSDGQVIAQSEAFAELGSVLPGQSVTKTLGITVARTCGQRRICTTRESLGLSATW
jgi:hypothetical protein